MRLRVPVPPNGRLLGPDEALDVQPCGCRIEVLDGGIVALSCGDPLHLEAHRDVCAEFAADWGVRVEETPA